MPNLLRDALSAIYLKYFKRGASVILTVSGYSVLLWADWRIALGVFLADWGQNVFRSF